MKHSQFNQFIKKYSHLWGPAFFIVIFILAFGIPFFIGTGVEKLTGDERAAATTVLYGLNQGRGYIKAAELLKLQFQYHVDQVIPLSPAKAKAYCYLDSDDSGVGYYAVKVSRVTIFGLRDFHTIRYDGCINSYE